MKRVWKRIGICAVIVLVGILLFRMAETIYAKTEDVADPAWVICEVEGTLLEETSMEETSMEEEADFEADTIEADAIEVNVMEVNDIEVNAMEAAAPQDISSKFRSEAEIWLAGEKYTGGNVTVTQGDNFSWKFNWSFAEDVKDFFPNDGDWFEKKLFTVPGLNLEPSTKGKLVIQGVYVGDWTLKYDKNTGVMTYRCEFHHYINFFELKSVKARYQGGGQFTDEKKAGVGIGLDTVSGTLVIEEKVEQGDTGTTYPGTGWKPASLPTIQYKSYAFGKGMKWNNAAQTSEIPLIEWRLVYLNDLQKIQAAYLDSGSLPVQQSSYCIIEDTLDENQVFQQLAEGTEKKYDGAPFYLEIPILLPGTSSVLNTFGGVAANTTTYDGTGLVYSVIPGSKFTEKATEAEVRSTPMTWAVIRDSEAGREKLIVNVGKLGTTDVQNESEIQGISWSMVPQKLAHGWDGAALTSVLNREIQKIETKKTNAQNGTDSPRKLLETRWNTLYNRVGTALGRSENAADKAAYEAAWTTYAGAFDAWKALQSSTYSDALAGTFPESSGLDSLKGLVVDDSGTVLSDTADYKNYKASADNLKEDQKTYQDKLAAYMAQADELIMRYQAAIEFHSQGQIFGFVMKYGSRVINTAPGTYGNTAGISNGTEQYSTDKKVKITFSHAVTGSYELGSLVLQKADSTYLPENGNDEAVIRQIRADGKGMAGVKFRVYKGTDASCVEDENKLVYFLDKEASAGGETWRATHTKETEENQTGSVKGTVTVLTTDAEGGLYLSGLLPNQTYWMMEEEESVPEGYYQSKEPVKLKTVKRNEVNWQVIPNVARAVELTKADADTGEVIPDTEFTLYRIESGSETKVEKFRTVTRAGQVWYQPRQDGSGMTLTTDADGKLRLYGLDAGEYILEESKAAEGYVTPDPKLRISFSLPKELPAGAAIEADGIYRVLLNEGRAVLNTPVKKPDPSPEPDSTQPDKSGEPKTESHHRPGRSGKTVQVGEQTVVSPKTGDIMEIRTGLTGLAGSLLGLILILAGQGRCRSRRKKVLAISEKLR